MGRITTPTYRLEITDHTGEFGMTPMAWRVRDGGKPTTENIDKWVTAFEASLLTHNKHLGIFSIKSARIVRQSTGDVVAEWQRRAARPNEPMFQIIG
jgi:hypothetical protein